MKMSRMTERLAHLGSARWALHVEALAQKARGRDVLLFTIGEPDVDISDELRQALVRALDRGRTGYSSGRGEPATLEAIAAKYAARSGRAVGPQNVLTFPGTQSALFAIMLGLVEAGDEVLVGDPLYATYDGVIGAAGAARVSVPLRPERGFRLAAEDLARAITPRSRVLLLNNPHNPTGANLTAKEVAEIGAVCREYDLWIVSDEVYEDLIFDGPFASPFDLPEIAERTIVASSISKSHAAPGLRSGWCVATEEVAAKLLPISESMLFGGQPFIADATAEVLLGERETAARMRTSYRHRAEIFAAGLDGLAGLSCRPPEAGMFILLDARETGWSGEALARYLLREAGVAAMPGESFGETLGGWLRLSLTRPDAEVRQAVERIGAAMRALPEAPAA